MLEFKPFQIFLQWTFIYSESLTILTMHIPNQKEMRTFGIFNLSGIGTEKTVIIFNKF
jgi:hypothetical protein